MNISVANVQRKKGIAIILTHIFLKSAVLGTAVRRLARERTTRGGCLPIAMGSLLHRDGVIASSR